MTNIIAFDSETTGLNWQDGDYPFLITWSDADTDYYTTLHDAEGVAAFTNAITGADIILAHNLPFDSHMIFRALGIDTTALAGKLVDTNILAKVVIPSGTYRESYKLKDLADKYLAAGSSDSETAIEEAAKSIGLRTLHAPGAYLKVFASSEENADLMITYAMQDTRLTYALYEYLLTQGEARDYDIVDMEMAVMPTLIQAEERGVAVDSEAVERLRLTYEERFHIVERELHELLGENIEGDDLAGKLVELGVPLTQRTRTGELSTAAYVFDALEDDHPIVGQIQEFRRMRKFLSSYVGPLEGRDSVHPVIWQLGAYSGRMSVSRPALQQLPKRAGKEVREALIPRPGHKFVVFDYESIELRLLAYYLADEDYRELIENGHDAHAWLASVIHGGVTEDYVKGSAGESLRNVAKSTTYAVCYGAGAPRISTMHKISIEEARVLIKQVKGAIPNFWRLNKRVKTKIEQTGYITTVAGRRTPVNPDKAYVGLNALIQGSAADCFKLGVIETAKAVEPLGGKCLLFIHDEIVVEAPEETAEQVAAAMEIAMVKPSRELGLSPLLGVEGGVVEGSFANA